MTNGQPLFAERAGLIRAHQIASPGTWSGAPSDRVILSYDERHRRRIALQGEGGLLFLLDLGGATVLRDGDALILEDGRLVEVRARPEPLLAVSGRDPHHLSRLVWHLGNRHVPAAIEPERVLIRPDPVIAEMLAGLGAEVSAIEAPFDPEGGAYAQPAGPAQSGHRHGPAPGSHPHRHD